MGTLAAEQLAAEFGRRLGALPERTTAAVRAVRRELSRQLADAAAAHVIELAHRLLARKGFEYRFVACELVSHHREALRSLGVEELERLGHGLDSWCAVDCFACYLAGPAWREGQVSDRVIHRWARSKDLWWRRAALVSTVPLNNKTRGGSGDPVRTLAVCALLVADREDLVVKALSWALRELAKRNPEAVRRVLSEWKDGLAPRVLREVRNKLEVGLKNPGGRETRS
jgi:3-methyladenine DNA glycosylase AlkD